MQIKNILKSLFLTSLYANVYAAKDDCKELGSFLKDAMIDCKMNDNGEMIELAYNTFHEEITEEGYKKALSYPTLKKLTFHDQYGDCTQLSYGLTNLKNLEELNIRSFRGKLVPNTLKGLTSLKKFAYSTGDANVGHFSKDNLEELGTLTNLESLSFGFVSLHAEDLIPLQNLSKLTILTLDSNGKTDMNVEEFLSVLKNIKEINVLYPIKYKFEVDAIISYANIEKLTIEFKKDKIECNDFNKLTKLHTLDLKISDVTEVPSCVYTIPNLKKLTFNEKDIPLQNGNNTNQTTGNNTNQTTGNNTNQTTGNITNQTTGNNANQTTGNNTNQTTGNDASQATGNTNNQAVGNDANQAIGNNTDQITGNITNGNTTNTTGPNDDINVDSGVDSTIVHAINYLPVIALVFRMLL